MTARVPPAGVDRAYAPRAPIRDQSAQTFTATVERQFRAGRVLLDLDLEHANRSDLTVSLVSPSGKRAVLLNHTGAARRDLKGTFDLTSVFDREEVKGEWRLQVSDAAKGDEGTLKSWGLRLEEGEARPIASAPQSADDQSLFAGMVSVGSTQGADGRYRLLDRSRGQGIETVDAVDTSSDAAVKPLLDGDDAWGSPSDSARQRTAVDAQYAAQSAYDFLRDVLGRDSLDGRGGKVTVQVHAGGLRRAKTLWMGDHVTVFDGSDGSAGRATVDLIGAELAKGLVQQSAQLGGFGEQWAVGDALAQILGGVGVEWYAAQRNPALAAGTDPFRIGEQFEGVDGFHAIDMKNPAEGGAEIDHYSAFDPNRPSRGSGIGVNAFYLLAHGGVNPTSKDVVPDGIGLEKGLLIFGRALLDRLPPAATYAQTRQATIDAASALYGSTSIEVERLQQAWNAVGVRAP